MKIRQRKKNKGFTLIEIMVTIAIFSLMFGIISGLFASALKAQRRSLATQELLAEASYVMEYMSRQLRMASSDQERIKDCHGLDAVNSYEIIQRSGQPVGIQFLNYQNCCLRFYKTVGNRLKQLETGSPACPVEGLGEAFMTSENVELENFDIRITGGPGSDPTQQARVTLFMKIRGRGDKPEEQPIIEIQNTISQRNLNVEQP